jgi:hypothetical protein
VGVIDSEKTRKRGPKQEPFTSAIAIDYMWDSKNKQKRVKRKNDLSFACNLFFALLKFC